MILGLSAPCAPSAWLSGSEWSTIPACPSLMCFFNGGNTVGTNSSKMFFDVCVFFKFFMWVCVGTNFEVFGSFVV